jgi:L-threonylcarbamoyladenylate synthase
VKTKTEVLKVNPADPEPELIARAAEALLAGRLVVFPTETVYGLGANALNAAAVQGIFAAKGRPFADPLIVHLASAEEIGRVAHSAPDFVPALAAAFWPGALTLILPKNPSVPDTVTANLSTVAVRVPAHPVALALLRQAAVPVAAPSANRFGRTSPTTAAHVLADLMGRVAPGARQRSNTPGG